jgi:hypothetical protein
MKNFIFNNKIYGKYTDLTCINSIHIHFFNGIHHGILKTVHRNGFISLLYYNINGKREGKEYKYYKTGNINSITNYKNDKLNGEYIEYYENNNIEKKCYYENYQLKGDYIEYNIFGEITIKRYHINNTEFYENGKHKYTRTENDDTLMNIVYIPIIVGYLLFLCIKDRCLDYLKKNIS